MSADDNAGEAPSGQMIHVVNLGAFDDMPTLFRQLGTDLFRRGSGVQFHDLRDGPAGQPPPAPEILDDWLHRFANFETFVEQLEGRLKRHSNSSGSALAGKTHSVILCLAADDVPPVRAPLEAAAKPKTKTSKNDWIFPQPAQDTAPEPAPEPETAEAYPVADKVKAALSRINVPQSVGVSTVVMVPMSSQGADDQKRQVMLGQLEALLKVPPGERQHHGRIGIVGATGDNGPRDAFICLRALILAMQTESQWTQLRDPNTVRTHVMTLDQVPVATSAEVIARALATSLAGPAGDTRKTAADGSPLTLKTFLTRDPGAIATNIEVLVPLAFSDAPLPPDDGKASPPDDDKASAQEIAKEIRNKGEADFLRDKAAAEIVNLTVNWDSIDRDINSLTPAVIPNSLASTWNGQRQDLAKKVADRREHIDKQRGVIEENRSGEHLVDAKTGLPAVKSLQDFRNAWETYCTRTERVTTAAQVLMIGITLFVAGILALLLGLQIDNNTSLLPISGNIDRLHFDEISVRYLLAFAIPCILGFGVTVLLVVMRNAAGRTLEKASKDLANAFRAVKLAEARALIHAQALARYTRLLSRLSACEIDRGDRDHSQSFQVNLAAPVETLGFGDLEGAVRESYHNRTESDAKQRILALLRDQSFGDRLPNGSMVFDGRENGAVVQRLSPGTMKLRFASHGEQSR
jgi:hypothetical protein